ncbi:autotransporter beta-domain protein [Leptotrichia sp. oral taxon 215 str. W9775]|uniref:autotransporter outer membrane beta-barrel domain-containing protein n=1 Tax=Leptotrichia sp. oral taxon 215 TaxID=712359 RepID=UPI0003AE11CB|nr:autotransporter outer membrane beta-barrel domain-containing protein [Leptotrichia sp. oral taxon 215]ERK65666.1 autotransporter beta-domain protein [Leptotrichia sp. oral taxon 215 str. W9775]
MNYFYGDWTGTYRGRGDKTPNQKYERFSSSKFATYSGGKYGMTDLNSKVIEPISSVPIDAAVKPKIPIIKTVDAAEAPVLTPPTLNISVSTVAPSNTTVPSITPPKVNIPTVTMSDVDGFTLAFPSSGYFSERHATHVNGIYNLTSSDTQSRAGSGGMDDYISYHNFTYHSAGITNPTEVTATMTGTGKANNIRDTSTYYGGGSRYVFVDDVRNFTGGTNAGARNIPTHKVKFTLRNEATIELEGPAIAAMLNEETSWTDGDTTTNITNMGSINDENENKTGSYSGTLRGNASGSIPAYNKTITANSKNKLGYKVGMTQTVEETVDWTSGTNYEFFNGSDTANASFTGFNTFDSTLEAAIRNNNNLTSLGTKGKNTKLDGTTNNFAQDGVIHFNGDFSTGIQIASENRTSSNFTPSTWRDTNARSLVRAVNKSNGYIQLDGSHSYGMKLAGTALHTDSKDYNDNTSNGSYLANEGLILISGSYDTTVNSKGSSAGIAKLKEAKWSSEKTLFNNGRIYVGGVNNSGILLESIFGDTVTNMNSGIINIDKAYNLFNNPDNTVNYSNAIAKNNAGIRVQSYETTAATDTALGSPKGENKGTINIKNGEKNVGIYVWDKNVTINGATGKQLEGNNTGTINITGGTNVGMMAQDDSGTTNFKTIIKNSGTIAVGGSGSIGMYTADKDSYAEHTGGTITASSNNVGVVNKGHFDFTGGTVTANGTNSVGVYSANGANSVTNIGSGTANSATLTVTNGGVGLYADAGSTQTLKGLNATVSGTNTAGSILFYNIPSTGSTAGKFDLSNNPGSATVGDYSFAFYTNKNIFTGGNTAFAQFLNDWKNTGTGNGINLAMSSSSSLLLADVTNASNKDIAFTNIVPPVTGTTLQNANSQKVATLSGDYKYLTIKGADVKIDENIDLSVATNKLNKVSIYDSNITVDTGKTIQDGAMPNVAASTNLTGQGYILGVNNGKTLTNKGTITLNSTTPVELKVLVATGASSKAINDGTVTSKINKGIGIYASNGAQGTNNGTKAITMDGDAAFGMVGAAADTENSGDITINGTSSVGMYSVETTPSKTAVNKGTITTTGAKNIGMVAENSNITNDALGTIKLTNTTENVGMYSKGTTGTITNDGKIEGIDQTIGIYGNTSTVLGNTSSITVGDSGVGLYSSTGDITVSSGAKIKLLKGGTGTTPADGATGVFVENKGSAGSVNVNVHDLIEGPLGKRSYGYFFKGVSNLAYTNTNGSAPVTLDDGAIFIYSEATGGTGIQNAQDLTAAGNDVIGIYQKGGIIKNSGKLDFNTGTKNTGIYTKEGTAINEAGGIIEVGATNFGMVTSDNNNINGKLINNSTIKITASKGTGMYSDSTATDAVKNNGLITAAGVTDAVGIYGKTVTNETTGTITMGDNSIGIYSNGGHVGNYGNLTVGANKSIGVLTVGTGQTVSFDGNITIGNDSFGLVNQGSGNHIVSTASNTTLGTDSVFIYQNDSTGRVENYTTLISSGDRNYGLYGNGTMDNNGTIDFSTGNGNVGMYATTGGIGRNYGNIKVGFSNTSAKEYGVGMATGYYDDDRTSPTYGQTFNQGTIENHGTIEVTNPNTIGMYAVGAGSKAVNYGNINLLGSETVGMYIDRGAVGENWGTIQTAASGLTKVKGVYVANGGYIKNYGTINIAASDSKSAGIWTDKAENAEEHATGVNPTTGGNQTGTSTPAMKVATASDMKDMGGRTIKVPPRVTSPTVTDVNGSIIPIYQVDTNAATPAPASAIVTSASGITSIDLSAGNFLSYPSASEASSLGMYVDTSGVNYTNPIQGINNLTGLTDIDLFFGTEASRYTTATAIEVGDNILKPYNDALSGVVTAGTTLNVTSASLTWMAQPTKNAATGLLDKVYLVKVPYTMFAQKGDTQTYNFLVGLEQRYGVEGLGTKEKSVLDKISNLNGGEGHILAQAFDEMKGHQYSSIQQRTKATGDILSKEFDYLQDEWRNPSKDNNKIKVFGHRGEYNTDSAGVVDYTNNAYGVAYVHENETVKLGRKSGWYAGVASNIFSFKDLGESKETQTMLKAGIFKTMSPASDHNGSLTWTIAGEAFASINNMKRRYWIVDETFEAKSDYTTYGAALKNELGYNIRTSARTSIRPYGALSMEYGRYSDIKEKGPMSLEVQGNDYFSVQPELGVSFNYIQPVGVKSQFKASLTAAYTNELGKINDVRNKARLRGTTADYYELRGDKEDRRGNGKFDLNIGFDNTRFGVTFNAGYDTKGSNVRGGLGFRAIY